MLRGRQFATHGLLPERDLQDLSDMLALRIYQRLGQRAYALSRQDVIELLQPYTDDLLAEDQQAVAWLVWDLLQEGLEIEIHGR